MRELLAIIGHGLIYFFQSVLASATIIGVLYLINTLVELVASIIPDWLSLSMPCLLILAVMFGICGGRVHE